MNVDAFGDAIPVPAFGPRMVCTSYGIIGAFARPNWQEGAEQESLTGVHWRGTATAASAIPRALQSRRKRTRPPTEAPLHCASLVRASKNCLSAVWPNA